METTSPADAWRPLPQLVQRSIELWDTDPDITLFGAWGPIDRGPDAVFDTFEWVAGRFGPEGGLACEHTVVQMSGSHAYTVGFERSIAQVDGRPPVPEDDPGHPPLPLPPRRMATDAPPRRLPTRRPAPDPGVSGAPVSPAYRGFPHSVNKSPDHS